MIQFEKMGIVPEILEAISGMGFKEPMPVQEQVIPLLPLFRYFHSNT